MEEKQDIIDLIKKDLIDYHCKMLRNTGNLAKKAKLTNELAEGLYEFILEKLKNENI